MENNHKIDIERLQNAVKEMLVSLGYDCNNNDLKETPKRVARFWREFLNGKYDTKKFIVEDIDGLTIGMKVQFYSLCEHHLIPFYGWVTIFYEPSNNQVLGASKIVKIVDKHARKLQLQERLTRDIANEFINLGAKSVRVRIKAKHLCMIMRGVKRSSVMITDITLPNKQPPNHYIT